jgi:DNA helicase-2/ATP-dependent DNA helicase PcrA
MNNNKLIIAAAGSGKTTYLINKAINIQDGKVLITTYTQANEAEIRKKIIEEKNHIPENIDIKTWFSFLLKHGAKPYQSYLYEKKINGLILVNQQSAQYTKETNVDIHYFNNSQKIYSDKISKFVIKCNENGEGCVINRISKIYSHIFIDEVQDLAGYDLDIIKCLFECDSSILLVGDPRQGTYSTNTTQRHKKYRKSEIKSFFEENFDNQEIEIDKETLNRNYRCNSQICNLSDKLFPDMPTSLSNNTDTNNHKGVFLVKKNDIETYLKKYNPMQLRDSKRTCVNPNFPVMNFGLSKGLTFDRVLIYPTIPICKWLENRSTDLPPTSRAKFYVAITRARYSVGIVYEYDEHTDIDGVKKYCC